MAPQKGMQQLSLSVSKQHTKMIEDLIAWERSSGRGWCVYPYPVPLEPPFIALSKPTFTQVIDDARRPSFISRVQQRLLNWSTRSTSESETSSLEKQSSNSTATLIAPQPIAVVQLGLPQELKVTQESAVRFFLSTSTLDAPLSFELIGYGNGIVVQFAIPESYRDQLITQLRAFYPDVALYTQSDLLQAHWNQSKQSKIIEYGLARAFMLPIQTQVNFETADALISFLGALASIEIGECGVVQVLFQRTRQPWADCIYQLLSDQRSKAFFDTPELVGIAKKKLTSPLFAVVIRIGANAATKARVYQLVQGLSNAFNQFTTPMGNEFIPVANYPVDHHEASLLQRITYRSGALLNLEELISVAHLPASSVRVEKLKRERKRTKAAPPIAVGNEIVLGDNFHNGKVTNVTVSIDHLMKHCFILGSTGSGKSSLVEWLVDQILPHAGISIIDPHGQLVDNILGQLPDDRLEDVILLDGANTEYPIPFNIFATHSQTEKHILASDLVAGFQRFATSWGDQMSAILGNACLAFLENTRTGTLVDLKRFLVEADFRKEWTATCLDEEVRYFWTAEYPLIKGTPQASILTRLSAFLRPKPIRYMLAQKENRLNFRSIMDNKKIFLAKLSHGAMGESNSYLLASLLIAKITEAAFSRQDIDESLRVPHVMFADEVQHYITPSLVDITSGTRKFRLSIVAVTQNFLSLWNSDKDVASSFLVNPFTRICFRLGDSDAERLANGFSYFDAKDLQNLGVGEAIARIEQNDFDFNLKTHLLPKVDPLLAQKRREKVLLLTQERYGRRREVVEAELAQSRPISVPVAAKPKAKGTPKEKSSIEVSVPTIPAASGPDVQVLPPLASPPTLGRGGPQHRYLQQLLKQLGEHHGYRSIIEKPVLDGAGSVDVSLEKQGKQIACEISITTPSQHEIGNIQKCLAAGYDLVVFLSSEKRTIQKVKVLASKHLTTDQLEQVLFFLPEEFVEYLARSEKELPNTHTEETVKGYKVKVKYTPVDEQEGKAQRQAIASVIMKAMKRMKTSDE
jgi:hypothetical protein